MTLKETLEKLEDSVLTELLGAAQMALNDTRTANRVAKEFGVPLARVQALAYLATQLSMEPNREPDITTMADMYALQSKLALR